MAARPFVARAAAPNRHSQTHGGLDACALVALVRTGLLVLWLSRALAPALPHALPLASAEDLSMRAAWAASVVLLDTD